jgi:hypothetical protein
MKIINIDGGSGRCLAATAALETNFKDKGEKVIVITPWVECFQNAPYIHKLYHSQQVPYLWDDVVKHGEYLSPEPYHSHYYYRQQYSLSQTFDHLINGSVSFQLPTIYLSPEEIKMGLEIVAEAKRLSGKGKAVAFQAFGAGANLQQNGTIVDPSNRSLTKGTVDKILNNPDCVFINLSHIPMNHPFVWQQPELTIRKIMAIASACDFVVTIDSLLSHIGAAFQKPGVLMLGGTFKENVGNFNYTICQKEGFPKSYCPNRFHGFIDLNNGAMDFSEDEEAYIIKTIGDLCK